ncbi:hypothetical protein AOX63_10625 [Pseudomonas sp. ADP]|nr:hypothetical protein AOX63_10625 [Pseudomonas sp. ADP]OBP07778.1 hypothetical protein BAE52_26870 [Pseudomonas sp. EGD-AKN5]
MSLRYCCQLIPIVQRIQRTAEGRESFHLCPKPWAEVAGQSLDLGNILPLGCQQQCQRCASGIPHQLEFPIAITLLQLVECVA